MAVLCVAGALTLTGAVGGFAPASAGGAPAPKITKAKPGDVDAAPGASVAFTVEAKNSSKRWSGAAPLVFLWSDDGSVSDAQVLGDGSIPPLRRKKGRATLPFNITVPTSATDDNYRLMVCTPRPGDSPKCLKKISVDVKPVEGASGTPAPTTCAASSSALPSSLLNLGNWKITLPVDRDGNGVADEVMQPSLNSLSDPCWFHSNSAASAVVFRANAGGETTSGSYYPRSELREMNGSSLAYWDPKIGQNVMTVTEAITATPAVKPEVVSAQIHDGTDDVLQIRLEGTKLFVESDGSFVGSLTDAYQLGTPFTVSIVANSSGISVIYNGVSKVSNFRPSGVGSKWYFKAGCYTQSNTSKGDAADAYGEVLIYKNALSIQHG